MDQLRTPLTLRALLTERQYAAFTAAWAELRGGLPSGSGSLSGGALGDERSGESLPGGSLTGPDALRVRDLSWPERESTVLHLSGPGVSWILKTAGNTAYSVGREARARAWTGPLEAHGTVAHLLWYDDAAPPPRPRRAALFTRRGAQARLPLRTSYWRTPELTPAKRKGAVVCGGVEKSAASVRREPCRTR